eukprot:Rhum_TRINITY_DN9896_c0_g1::Rhum_TRINITY_DN9896_c0_g1_i1::g.35440::m.35440
MSASSVTYVPVRVPEYTSSLQETMSLSAGPHPFRHFTAEQPACVQASEEHKVWWLRRVHRYLLQPDDTPLLSERKWALVVIYSCLLPFSGLSLPMQYSQWGVSDVFVLTALAFVWTLGAACALAVTKTCSNRSMYLVLAVWVLLVALGDLAVLTRMRFRVWPFFVLGIDVSYILRLPDVAPQALLVFVLVYGVAAELELVLRVTAWGHPGSATVEQRRDLFCGCSEPPCSLGVVSAVSEYITMVAILVMQWCLHRSSQKALAARQSEVESSVIMAEEIAGHLSEFDLDSAEELLGGCAACLPHRMDAALSCLLANLRCYRPYLPDTLFDRLHGEGASERPAGARVHRQRSSIVRPPGVGTSEAAIVFTDIVGSTALWVAAPEAMSAALMTHNSTIRKTILVCGGYEVKTIGDAFMVAFSDLKSAVRFGLSAQLDLFNAAWPASLLALESCRRDTVWCGLTVRIGVHCGAVTVDAENVASRADYFGTTVNTAARCETHSAHGGVTMLRSLLNSMGDVGQPCVVKELGERALKGLGDNVELVALFPTELQQRQQGRCTHTEHSDSAGDLSTLSGGRTHATSRLHHSSSHSGSFENVIAKSSCTVGAVEILCPSEIDVLAVSSWSTQLAYLLTCTERCHGKVSAVVGASACVSWNAASRCLMHVDNSFRFASLLVERCVHDGEEEVPVYSLASCTGEAACSAVGSATRRFVNVVGECVGTSRRLALATRLYGVECLYANLLPNYALPPYVRKACTEQQDISRREGMGAVVYVVAPSDCFEEQSCEASPILTARVKCSSEDTSEETDGEFSPRGKLSLN